jgi:hypothetical protein
MIYSDINELPKFETLTVIINVDTYLSTTLAVLSAAKYTEFPILIVDCSKNNFELNYFEKILNSPIYYQKNRYYLIALPLKIHGETLDILFRRIKANSILLLDSDAEITNFSFFENDLYDDDRVFGIGFTNGPAYLSKTTGEKKFIYYQERMFAPCVLLKTKKINEAIDAGCTFSAKIKFNDFPLLPYIGKQLNRRFRFKYFRDHDIPILNLFRQTYNDYNKPSKIYYDTGSEIYMYLRYKCCYYFIGIPGEFHTKYFNHYLGLTRSLLNQDNFFASGYNDVTNKIIDVLTKSYGFDVSLTNKN